MSAIPKRTPNPRGSPFNFKRDGGWQEYSNRKQAWLKAHPEASSREIDAAARAIAKRLGL